MANCTGRCSGSVSEIALLTSILNQDRATFVRLQQVVQAFQIANGDPQTNQGSLPAANDVCSQSELGLLSLILDQRNANFIQLGTVLSAV